MTQCFFNPEGGPLVGKAIFLGNLVADYGMFLKEKNSNSKLTLLEGDNVNPQDDVAYLPLPVIGNNGRRVSLETLFYGNNPSVDKDYEISLEIWQNDQLIGKDTDKNDATYVLSGKAQYSLQLIQLIAKP